MVLNNSDNDMILVYQYKSGNNLEFTRKRTAINQHYYASYMHVFKSRLNIFTCILLQWLLFQFPPPPHRVYVLKQIILK